MTSQLKQLQRRCRHTEQLLEERTAELEIVKGQLQQHKAAAGRARQMLQKTLQRYQHLFDNLSDVVFWLDTATGRIVEANRQGERLLGRSRTSIVGMHACQLHPPEETAASRQRLSQVKEERRSTCSGRVVRQDGSCVPVEITATIFDAGEKPLILMVLRALSDHDELVEQPLWASEL